MKKIRRRVLAGVILASALFIISCSTMQPDSAEEKELTATDGDKSAALLKVLADINAGSPDTINSTFTADGETPGKKFRVEGRAVYDKKGYYYITLTDYIFRSPVIDAYREGDKLYFYYPVEKKLLVDDINKINFYNYSGFKVGFAFMQTLFTGGIPVITDYSLNKVLKEGEGAYYLILENSEYFENIYFNNNLPEKILLMHKQSREKAEVYLKSLTRKDKSYFFRKIKIIAPGLGMSINLSYSRPQINEPVIVKKVDSLKLKKGIEVIKIN